MTPWQEFLLIGFTLFFTLKAVTTAMAWKDQKPASPGRLLGYWFLWPGMNARMFLSPEVSVVRPTGWDWVTASTKMLFGLVLLLVVLPRVDPSQWLLRDWAALGGLGFTVAFGFFHLVALVWLATGVRTKPIMDRPLTARSLGEFWGRRWNRAVHDVLHDLFFRPLARRIGLALAVTAAFVMSGLLHELVFSIPARGGLGLCTLYFMIQLVGVWFERQPIGRRLGLGRGWRGWLFCAAVVLAPVYLLFHRPLLDRVMYPALMQMGLL